MMPVMSNITLLRINKEKNRMSAIIAMAPTKAPASREKKPERLNEPAVTLPPNNKVTSATPKPAPELTPKMEVPAKGLRNTVCNINPHTANALPDNIAVSA